MGASQEAGGSRAVGLWAQLPCSGGRSDPGQDGGGEHPQLPAAPALVGESVVEQAPPVGPSAIAPWG